MGEQVSAEAVEAGRKALIEHDTPADNLLDRHDGYCCPGGDAHDMTYKQAVTHQASATLTAALPYLAAHQPARVVPSVDEVARSLRGFEPSEYEGTESLMSRWRERAARTVLALLASQPTVAEVREQVAREIEAEIIPNARNVGQDAEYLNDGLRLAARIARTETKGAE